MKTNRIKIALSLNNGSKWTAGRGGLGKRSIKFIGTGSSVSSGGAGIEDPGPWIGWSPTGDTGTEDEELLTVNSPDSPCNYPTQAGNRPPCSDEVYDCGGIINHNGGGRPVPRGKLYVMR